MDHYQKTTMGIQALRERNLNLSARQRRLLVLIGTRDFTLLNSHLKQKLDTPELLQQLETMGLITHPHLSSNKQIGSSQLNLKNNSPLLNLSLEEPLPIFHIEQPEPIKPIQKNAFPNVENSSLKDVQFHSQFSMLKFDEIQHLMINLLQQHCGLMAKQLIQKIKDSNTPKCLKHCQIQWLTTLQESKIDPSQLNQCLQQINHALIHIVKS